MDYSTSNQEKLIYFFYVIYKRKWFVMAFFIITFLGIVAGTWLTPQYYKATTKILIHTNPKQEISLFPDLARFSERSFKANLAQDMVQILTGEELGREIVSSFQLDKLYYKRYYEPESYRDIAWYYIHKAIDVIKSPYTYSKLLLVHLGLVAPDPGENYSFLALQEFLDDWLDVSAARETKVINLSVWGLEPRLSSDIANRMAKLLVDRTLVVTREQAIAGYEFTANQLHDVEDKFFKSQDILRRFREESNIISIDEQKKFLLLSLEKFQIGASEIDAELNGVTEKANEIRTKLQKENEKIISSEVTGNNIFVLDLKSRLKNVESNLNSMLLEKTEKHIDVLKLRVQINETKDKLKKELENIVLSETEGINPVHQNLRQELINLETQKIYFMAKKKSLESTISEIRKELALMPRKEMELQKLETIADVHKTLYSTVKDKLEKLLILKANDVNEFGLSIITKADLPEVMLVTWPWWDINTIYVGLPLSVFIALLACFSIDYWIDTFRTKKEIEFNLESPVIGTIPDLKEKKPKILRGITTDQLKMKGLSVDRDETMPDPAERRSYSRVAIECSMLSVPHLSMEKKHEAMLRNMSEDGLCFESPESLAPDAIIKPKILFDIDGIKKQLEVCGKVVWTRCVENGKDEKSFAIGIQFVELEENEKSKIQKLIEKRRMSIENFRKDHHKNKYLAGENSHAHVHFGTMADNACWNALEKSDDKIYLVTSASLREGKTTTAVNLALNIARRGRKVLLIDADLRNPTIGEVFCTGSLPGLTQLICNSVSIQNLILPVEECNIHLITSGKIDQEPFEVLTSPKVTEILYQAKKLYDFVIVDCTAVNFYIDPLLLCPLVDQVIFVVLADKTEKNNVLIAKAKILNADGKILGVVLNRKQGSFLHNGT